MKKSNRKEKKSHLVEAFANRKEKKSHLVEAFALLCWLINHQPDTSKPVSWLISHQSYTSKRVSIFLSEQTDHGQTNRPIATGTALGSSAAAFESDRLLLQMTPAPQMRSGLAADIGIHLDTQTLDTKYRSLVKRLQKKKTLLLVDSSLLKTNIFSVNFKRTTTLFTDDSSLAKTCRKG